MNAQMAVAKLNSTGGARSDRSLFERHFELPRFTGNGYRIDLSTKGYLTGKKPSPKMKAILRQFRAWARFFAVE